MSKKNDDSIERFFQKAASQQDNSHVDQDWRAMEKLLDDNQAAAIASDKKPMAGKLIRNTIVVALILSGWLFYGISEYNKSTSTESDELDPVGNDRVSQETEKENKKDTNKQAVGGVLGPQNQNSKRVAADLFSSASEGAVKQTRPSSNVLTFTDDPRSTVNGQKQAGATTLPQSSNPQDQIDLTNSLGPVANNGSSELPDKLDDGFDRSFEKNPSGETFDLSNPHPIETTLDDSTRMTPVNKVEENKPSADESEEDDKRVAEKFPRWSVLLSLAPDFSSTKVGRYNSPGVAYGGLISFRPLRRLQISTGIFKASKQYEGYGDEYQPPYGYWDRRTNGRVPDEVYGSCDILDWPILVRYDVLRTKGSTIFLNGGISSYRMVDEKYEYTFATENPGAVSGWESHEPVDYSFSIGNISVGYERQLSQNVSIQIEPYLKLPFKAIGWSNIDLHTTGVYFSVRYTFIRKRLLETLQP